MFVYIVMLFNVLKYTNNYQHSSQHLYKNLFYKASIYLKIIYEVFYDYNDAN